MIFSFFCSKNGSLGLNITYTGLIGLLIFMSFAVHTVPERFSDSDSDWFDFHIVILKLLLPELFLKYISPT